MFLFFFSAFSLLSFLPPFSSSRILPLREGKALNKLIDEWFEHWLELGLPLEFTPLLYFCEHGLAVGFEGLGLGNSGLGIDTMACLWIGSIG